MSTHKSTGLMNIPMGLPTQHTLIQVPVVSSSLFRVSVTSFSPCAHRWAQGQAWVSMSTWLSREASNPPWEMQSTWQPSGEYPSVQPQRLALLSPGATKQTGDSGVDL